MSREREGLTAGDVVAIGKGAKKFNSRCNITGFFIHAKPYFFQTVEGKPADIDRVYAIICADRRHTDVKMLERTNGPRQYPPWSMEVVDLDSPQQDRAKITERSERVSRLLGHAMALRHTEGDVWDKIKSHLPAERSEPTHPGCTGTTETISTISPRDKALGRKSILDVLDAAAGAFAHHEGRIARHAGVGWGLLTW